MVLPLAAVALSICGGGMALGQSSSLPKSLKHNLLIHYSFDQTTYSGGRVIDESAWNHHGRLQGDAKIVMESETEGFLSLDGNEDFLSLDVQSSYRSQMEDVTISLWVRPHAFGNNRPFLRLNDSIAFTMGWHGKMRKARFVSEGSGHNSKLSLRKDEWHHLVAVKEGMTVRLYFDGKLDSKLVLRVLPLSQDLNSLRVGATSGFFLKGDIDSVRVYDRAISGEEILALYREHRERVEGMGPILVME